MAFQSKSGEKFTNASQANAADKRIPRQPVKNLPTPDAPRDPAPQAAAPAPAEQHEQSAPHVEIAQEGDMYTVTAKFASAEEAHAAAQSLSGDAPDTDAPAAGNPAQAMM